VVENIPWSTIGQTRAKVVVSDKGGYGCPSGRMAA
jgi:hypothetical protein